MLIHDWTHVRANRFHDFHQSWTIAIRNALNAGRLPPGFFALVEQQAGGPEARVTLQRVAQEIQVGIDETIPQPGMVVAEAIGFQGAAHGLGMQAEFRGNGADLPVFGMKQMANASDFFVGNHAAPPKTD